MGFVPRTGRRPLGEAGGSIASPVAGAQRSVCTQSAAEFTRMCSGRTLQDRTMRSGSIVGGDRWRNPPRSRTPAPDAPHLVEVVHTYAYSWGHPGIIDEVQGVMAADTRAVVTVRGGVHQGGAGSASDEPGELGGFEGLSSASGYRVEQRSRPTATTPSFARVVRGEDRSSPPQRGSSLLGVERMVKWDAGCK